MNNGSPDASPNSRENTYYYNNPVAEEKIWDGFTPQFRNFYERMQRQNPNEANLREPLLNVIAN